MSSFSRVRSFFPSFFPSFLRRRSLPLGIYFLKIIDNGHVMRHFFQKISQTIGWFGPKILLCWSALNFWKVKFEKSSSTNWIFSLPSLNWIFTATVVCKTNFKIDFCRLEIQFVKLDFSNLIFQKSSTDG